VEQQARNYRAAGWKGIPGYVLLNDASTGLWNGYSPWAPLPATFVNGWPLASLTGEFHSRLWGVSSLFHWIHQDPAGIHCTMPEDTPQPRRSVRYTVVPAGGLVGPGTGLPACLPGSGGVHQPRAVISRYGAWLLRRAGRKRAPPAGLAGRKERSPAPGGVIHYPDRDCRCPPDIRTNTIPALLNLTGIWSLARSFNGHGYPQLFPGDLS